MTAENTKPRITFMTMHRQRGGFIAPAGTRRTRDSGQNAAAHRPRGNHLHQHDAGKDQRHASKSIRAELRYKACLDEPRCRLRNHDEDIGPRHAQQHGRDRALQQPLSRLSEVYIQMNWSFAASS
jgi:hypothetical protein